MDFPGRTQRLQLPAPVLPMARYRFTFEAHERITLPPWQANLWRGALGLQWRNLCGSMLPLGTASQTSNAEFLRYVFETPSPPDASKMRRYPHIPRPYVIAAPWGSSVVARGAPFGFDLTLIGYANDALSAIASAFGRAGEEGIGTNRRRANLCSIENVALTYPPGNGSTKLMNGKLLARDIQSPDVPPMSRRISINLMTPLRLMTEEQTSANERTKRRGTRRQVLVGPEKFTPDLLLDRLSRRVSMLMTFHTNADLDESLFTDLKAARQEVWMHQPQLRMVELSRWSMPQQSEIDASGLMGEFKLDLGKADCLWPYLWLGQWVHAGKGTVHGLGAYRLESL